MFSGTLYFDDGSDDRLTVNRLIIRDNEIAFNIVATWNGMTTLIELDGIASHYRNEYISEGIIPKPINSNFHPVTITVHLLEPFENGISIEGSWETKMTKINFSGDLENTINH
ncbi:hypothetical protein [Pseudomonas izuensis]|uniref:Uncharacterized protein n=1 Tax=Pseudomonas izuensis TaxID=2684212 RepID=A0ABM7RN58_9PSED|nr:hypothetical protein [Pseudomonas izuensis]BCX67124.1 hypothetical protein LAB08_R17480 [Pseudomonas izuensis]